MITMLQTEALAGHLSLRIRLALKFLAMLRTSFPSDTGSRSAMERNAALLRPYEDYFAQHMFEVVRGPIALTSPHLANYRNTG